MSENLQKNSEIVALHVPSGQALIHRPRWRVAIVLVVMGLVVVAGLFMPSAQFLTNYPRVTASQASVADSNLGLSAEVNALKGQVVGLVSGSIESKLRNLEASVRSGTLTTTLGTIEELKNDLKVLRTYTQPAPKEPDAAAVNAQLMQEMAQLKRLIYLTIGSCSLLLAVFAGVWLKQKRLPYKDMVRKLKARL